MITEYVVSEAGLVYVLPVVYTTMKVEETLVVELVVAAEGVGENVLVLVVFDFDFVFDLCFVERPTTTR